MTIDIVVADDHEVLRWGLVSLLEAQQDMHVVGTAADGVEAVLVVGQAHPSVVILDLCMPGGGGLDALPGLVRTQPRPAILVLSAFDDEEHRGAALAGGADAYVSKGAPPVSLLAEVRRLGAGNSSSGPDSLSLSV